jgi:putative transposase
MCLKKGVIWKRTRQSHRENQDPVEREVRQADLDMLGVAAAAGEIDLFYTDESGFNLWMRVTCSYFLGESKNVKNKIESKADGSVS